MYTGPLGTMKKNMGGMDRAVFNLRLWELKFQSKF